MNALSETEVRQLVVDWYRKLDVHAPLVELLPLLAEEGLEMRFPEATTLGQAGFEAWYQGVIRLFFDEVHELRKVDVALSQEQAHVTLIVNWQARRWRPPAPKSEWLGFDAAQRWVVCRSSVSGRPVIQTYIVDELRPMPGSHPL